MSAGHLSRSVDQAQRTMAERSLADGRKVPNDSDCALGAHVACPCVSERLRELERTALTEEEREAVVLRITDAQTVKRMPNYRVHLESARRKLADQEGS